MVYRLVRMSDSQDYGQIFDEETSELIGSVIKTRRWVFFRQYQIRIDDEIVVINRSILSGRKWRINDYQLTFDLFGSGLSLKNKIVSFSADGFVRDKLTLKNADGRTAAIIDPNELKSKEMVIIEDYDKIEKEELLATSVLILERYGQW